MHRTHHFPLGSKLHLADLNLNPYPVFDRLRAAEPVTWAEPAGMWLVTRRSDVLRVLTDSATFTTDSPHSTIRMAFGSQMLSTEGEQQARYKRHCFPAFRPEALEARMRPVLRAMALELVDRLPEHAELRSGFASPIAIGAIGEITGIPRTLRPLLDEWYPALSAALANFSGDAGIRCAGMAAAAHVRAMLSECLRSAPSDAAWPLLSMLRQPSTDALTEEEIVDNCLVILFGGIETTEAAILNAVWALLTHPAQTAQAIAAPAMLAGAIEESLRWEAAVQSCTRHAVTDSEISGVRIEAGETVQCMIGAANRDPEFFDDPHRFDAARPNAAQHLTFGYGRHSCLGAALARLNLTVGLAALFERRPKLELDGARSIPPQGYEFRKPSALWVG